MVYCRFELWQKSSYNIMILNSFLHVRMQVLWAKSDDLGAKRGQCRQNNLKQLYKLVEGKKHTANLQNHPTLPCLPSYEKEKQPWRKNETGKRSMNPYSPYTMLYREVKTMFIEGKRKVTPQLKKKIKNSQMKWQVPIDCFKTHETWVQHILWNILRKIKYARPSDKLWLISNMLLIWAIELRQNLHLISLRRVEWKGRPARKWFQIMIIS